ncbi:MAG: nucleotidyltransferase family protein [Planctomycetia bacterium]|nr:nucleotidyltransferase family protein [Planctomycetia bacterium]
MLEVSPLPRLFAIVPAAGHSRRMGRPKLLLPLGATTVIARMLGVLRRPEIVETIVVIRPDDEPLRAAVAACGATTLQPTTAPPEMRQSVEHALQAIERKFDPAPDDGWLLAPADHPLLDSAALDPVISAWTAATRKIVVPVHEGRRGHPTIFPFALAKEVFSLPADQGLNRLLQVYAADVLSVAVASAAVVTDLDTPEDYERLRDRRTS